MSCQKIQCAFGEMDSVIKTIEPDTGLVWWIHGVHQGMLNSANEGRFADMKARPSLAARTR
jgi:hypothetical protein